MKGDVFTALRSRAAERGSKPFLRCIDEPDVSYRTVVDRAETYADAFESRGLSRGEVVGLFLENRPAFVYALFGGLARGLTVACINTEMRGRGLRHLLERAEISTLISDDELLAGIENDCRKAGVESSLSVTDDSAYDQCLAVDGTRDDSPDVDPTNAAVLLHTSGTTGLPKWCSISHSYLLRLGEYVADQFEIAATDTVFNPLPLYHINPLGYYLMGGLSAGAKLGMVDGFSVSQFWNQVHELDVTIVILHMAPKDMLLERTTPEDASGHSIRVMFPADRALIDRFEIPKMVTGYGSTEAGGLTHTNKFTRVPGELSDEEDLSQFAGYPRDDVECRLVDADGKEVPRGVRGEILVRPTASGAIFDGYYNDAEKTVEAWSGLWFNTDDLGYIDESGALHFVGRISDTISHKGQFVNTDLVEAALESQDGVVDAVVVGHSDDIVGERVKAFVRRSADLAAADLLDSIETELPTFMLPEIIAFVDTFPRIEGTAKVNRQALRERDPADSWRVDRE